MKKFIFTLIIIAELLVISATAMLIIENFNQKKEIKKKGIKNYEYCERYKRI